MIGIKISIKLGIYVTTMAIKKEVVLINRRSLR